MSPGQSSKADDILNKDFVEIAPIFGTETKGRDNFKKQIDGLFSVSICFPLMLPLISALSSDHSLMCRMIMHLLRCVLVWHAIARLNSVSCLHLLQHCYQYI